MKYFFILIIAFLIPNIANANNFNFECSGWYIDEDNKKNTSDDYDYNEKATFTINIEKNIILMKEWIYANGVSEDISNTMQIYKITEESIFSRGRTLDGEDTWDAIYNYKNKIFTNINYENNDTNKIYNKWHAIQCNDINNLELALLNLEKEIEKNQIVKTQKEDHNTLVPASSGTGFIVSNNGHMVTNNHVIDSCDIIKTHYKGRELDTNVLFIDRTNDLAIIKANIKPNKVFSISKEDVSILEDIIVAGYPLGKNISASIKTFKGSVTSLAGYGDNYSNFQIDASLSTGNSGGPIIDQKGNIVGVAVAKYIEEGVEGFNFGVKSSTLKTFASSNQFKFQDPSTEKLSNKELGQLITEATIYLECWMSVAKIKQIIEEGERQKSFFSDYK